MALKKKQDQELEAPVKEIYVEQDLTCSGCQADLSAQDPLLCNACHDQQKHKEPVDYSDLYAMAAQHMATAKRHLEQGSTNQFHQAMGQALRIFKVYEAALMGKKQVSLTLE